MKLAVMGTGYVGLVAGTCFAETGNDVICVDIDEEKIAGLQQGRVPIYEPGLEELLDRNLKEERLGFTTDAGQAIQESRIVFIAVGTPTRDDGSPDLCHVLEAARKIGAHLQEGTVVVNKSTVPIGTCDRIREIIAENTGKNFEVVSNPEFLKEGTAVEDFMKPDRVVIGSSNSCASDVMKELYSPFVRTGAPVLVMDNRSAEMTKYAANAMLATRISFMNEIANLCELTGADIHNVRQGVGLDRRIGPTFLFAGLGYGGSCFPKDIRALTRLGRELSYPLRLIEAVEEVNENQKRILLQKIVKYYLEKNQLEEVELLAGKTFAVWGLSFKPRTDDMREAPSRVIIEKLLQMGARVQAYDPEAIETARGIFGDSIDYAESNYEALHEADALLLITEWNVFRNPDFEKMKRLLKHPVIFDGRNQYNPAEMRQLGFDYFGVGRS